MGCMTYEDIFFLLLYVMILYADYLSGFDVVVKCFNFHKETLILLHWKREEVMSKNQKNLWRAHLFDMCHCLEVYQFSGNW